MVITFEKWHGCGNDFIVILDPGCTGPWLGNLRDKIRQIEQIEQIEKIEIGEQSGEELRQRLIRQAPKMCLKDGTSIGADGILLISPAETDPSSSLWHLTIINADGSCADNCGNGLRVATLALWKALWKTDEASAPSFSLFPVSNDSLYWRVHCGETYDQEGGSSEALSSSSPCLPFAPPLCAPFARTFRCLVVQALAGPFQRGWVGVDMSAMVGEVAPQETEPVMDVIRSWAREHQPPPSLQPPLPLKSTDVVAQRIGNRHLTLLSSTMGAQHLVDLEAAISSAVGKHHWNIHVYQPRTPLPEELQEAQGYGYPVPEVSLEMIPWERGVGLTRGCGSGACAVALSYLQRQGVKSQRPWSMYQNGTGPEQKQVLAVNMPGGRVWVSVGEQERSAGAPAELSLQLWGPGEHVFSGTYDL